MENLEQPKWYVVHTYSGYENSVETDLRNMIENNNLQDYIFDIKIPVEDDVVERNGKKKVIQRKKFPSYVFIKMIYTNHIRIVNGALENFIGVVESISAERQKVKVIVAMFGRQTPVELDFAQVEKL